MIEQTDREKLFMAENLIREVEAHLPTPSFTHSRGWEISLAKAKLSYCADSLLDVMKELH